jgi:hypothetical protein
LLIKSLASAPVTAVHLVDGGDKLVWKQVAEGLSVELPAQQRGEHAFGLRIAGAIV